MLISFTELAKKRVCLPIPLFTSSNLCTCRWTVEFLSCFADTTLDLRRPRGCDLVNLPLLEDFSTRTEILIRNRTGSFT
jgi:hypothetical protein